MLVKLIFKITINDIIKESVRGGILNRLDRIYNMSFVILYPNYILKAEKKNRTKEEVNLIIEWLFGYSQNTITELLNSNITVKEFVDNAPKLNDDVKYITGKICGVVIEDIEDETMKRLRYLDKLVDELAKGKDLNKIFNRKKGI